MTEYPSNSHKSKEHAPAKKVEKVITGNAKTKKKSTASKFTDVFISEDMNSVRDYIILDVVVPAVKKAISDVVTKGIDMLLYGESGGSQKKSTASKISYRNYYDKKDDRRERYISRTRPGYSYDEVVIENRGDAEEVLSRMDDLIETYNVVSVADFYDLVDITGNYTDNNYGWTDLGNARVVRCRDGYTIKLPKAMPID